ncbi:MAG: GGDEF domain-containing protein [Clostridiales bacterium]|nr:GGDEF domain-containing protein [Clostridiales bacterium]
MSKNYAMMITTTDDIYQEDVWKSLRDRVSESDNRVFFFCGKPLNSPYGNQRYSNIIFKLIEHLPMDGMIVQSGALTYYSGNGCLNDFLRQFSDIPIVKLAEKGQGNSLVLNNHESSRMICKHLLDQHGYKEFAYISGPPNNYEAKERLNGMLSILEEYGLKLNKSRYYEGDFTEISGYKGAKEILEHDVPRVIVCGNDEMALGAIRAIHEGPLKVPEDIAVVGFDDIESAKLQNVPLTTVKQPFAKLVNRAYDILQGNHLDQNDFIGELQVRESCGCEQIVQEADTEAIEKNFYMGKYNNSLSHYNRMIYMATHFTSVLNLESLKIKLIDYFNTFHGSEIYLCLFEQGKIDIVDPLKFEYPEHMRLYFGYNHGEVLKEESFLTKKGLPDSIFKRKYSNSFLIYPILFDKTSYGYIVCDDKTAEDMSFIVLKNILDTAISRVDIYDQIESYSKKMEGLSLKDPLTGILNRRGFDNMTRKAFASQILAGKNPSIIYCDVNNLKKINDTYGHDAGDLVIKQAALTLEQYFKNGEVVARIGGDEFVVYIEHVTENSIASICRDFKTFIHSHNMDFNYPFTLSMEVGLSVYSNLENQSYDILMKQADLALYEKKYNNRK